MPIVVMTYNERKAFGYLISKANQHRKVKCSAHALGLKFNWSLPYCEKIFNRLQRKGFIDLVLSGIGTRPNLYRVEKVNLSIIRIKNKPSKKRKLNNLLDTNIINSDHEYTLARGSTVKLRRERFRNSILEHIYNNSVERNLKSEEDNKKQSNLEGARLNRRFSHINNKNNISNNSVSRDIDIKRNKKLVILENNSFSKNNILSSTTLSQSGPFRRFEEKKWNPKVWNANDVVCYYAYLVNSIYKFFPRIDWRRDCGAAKNLINAFGGKPVEVKKYLQLAFAKISDRKPPDSLSWFTVAWRINQVMHIWDDTVLLDECDDRFVLAS